MPLVQIHKARRKRPEWQDTKPSEEELRDVYRVAAKNEDRFARAFMGITRDILTSKVLSDLKRELNAGNLSGAMATIPWYNPGDPKSEKLWSKAAKKMSDAYLDIIRETGQEEYDRLGIDLKFKVEKAKKKIPVVPVNPFSIAWTKERHQTLLPEISNSMQNTLLQIVSRGVEQGLRAEVMAREFLKPGRLGLLDREEAAVQRRVDLMIEQGIPAKKVEAAGDRYARQLLRKRASRIARTETISAASRGRVDSWRLAVEQGDLPTNIQKRWIAVPVSPRTCEICLGLNGQVVNLNEPYFSDVLGREVQGPGMWAHPQCRCTEVIVRPPRPPKAPARLRPPRRVPVLPVAPPPRPPPPPPIRPEPERFATINSWSKSLSPDEKRAVEGWTGVGINSKMRKIDSGLVSREDLKKPEWKWLKERVDSVNKSLKTAPEYKGKIYRGLTNLSGDQIAALTTPGAIVDINGISSFSRSEGVGFNFATALEGSVLFEANITKGGYNIEKLSTFPIEKEVVVTKGKKFKIARAKKRIKKDEEYWHVELEEVE